MDDNNKVILKILARHGIKKREREVRHFDSSSISDLAFLLLIFFIVTSSFIIRQGVFFSLPSQSAASVRLKENQVIEVYPQDNGFLYNDELLDRSEFMQMIVDHNKINPDTVLIIYMNPQVKYDRLVDTLSVAKETGMKRVSLKNIGEKR